MPRDHRFDFGELLRRVGRRPPRPAPARRSAEPYHSVSIRIGKDACAAANAVAGRRFLAAKAPQLPLHGCNAERCTCVFLHHEDRRAEDRRADETLTPGFGGHNQRVGAGRRREDHEGAFDDEYFDYAGQRRRAPGDTDS
jgi:hypothetical protein